MACAPGFTSPAAWVLVIDPALPGEENMARDRAALEAQKNPAALPVVRFFRWDQPTMSFGRLQAPPALGYPAVRRPTGGGLVLHRGDLSFSVAWRRDHPVFPQCIKNVYRAFHEAAAEYLRQEGFAVDLQEKSECRPPGDCFSEPAEADVLWKGKKVLGGALQVTRWGRLYQGDLRTDELGMDSEKAAGGLTGMFEKRLFRKAPSDQGRPL